MSLGEISKTKRPGAFAPGRFVKEVYVYQSVFGSCAAAAAAGAASRT